MRKRTSHWAWLIVGWLIIVAATVTDAALLNSEFEAAKQTFLKDMKRVEPHSRATAVKILGKVVLPASAELLLKRGVTDSDPSVRKVARRALRQMAQNPVVNQFLFGELEKSVGKSKVSDYTAELLRALAITSDESRQDVFVKWFDDYLGSPKANLLLPMAVIDDFGQQGDVDAVDAVRMLAKVKIFESHFGYRRCVVQAMSQIRKIEAVDYLIDLLPRTDGLIQYDVIQYLTRVTKQKFRGLDRKWAKWWAENRDSFQFPPEEEASDEELDDDEHFDAEEVRYYGIPIGAKRVVFVLDTSGSMAGQPMEAAKMTLLKAIESLPEAVSFDIVMFDVSAATFRPKLTPATAEAKRSAALAVMERGMGGGTASNSALIAAFRLDPEAIYFISDGKPTDFPPDQILNSIKQMNRTRRISIHAVGLVTGNRGGGELRNFMSPLARQNWGRFRLIE